jgi:hypothetical protein
MTTKIESKRTIASLVAITAAAVTWIAMLSPAAASPKGHPAPKGAVLAACARSACAYSKLGGYGIDVGPDGTETKFTCNKTTCTAY